MEDPLTPKAFKRARLDGSKGHSRFLDLEEERHVVLAKDREDHENPERISSLCRTR